MVIRFESVFTKWLNKLKDETAQAKIVTRIDQILLGNFGKWKSVGGGVCELIIDYGPGYRVYYGKKGKEIVIILAGSTKRDQQKAVDKAKGIWAIRKKE